MFLLMQILLALFYSTYKNRINHELYSFAPQRIEYLNNMFDELDAEKKGYLTQE